MKKKLLGTSALVAFVTSMGVVGSAQAGVAQAPSLSIMGNVKGQAFGFKNGSPSGLTTITNSVGGTQTASQQNPRTTRGLGYLFTQRGELDFVVAGVAANGLEYNYSIVLTGDTAATKSVQENRIELKGSWGTFQFGDKTGPADILMNDAVNVLGGTGGFDGDWSQVVAQSTGTFNGDSMVPDTGTNTKAIYYTPRFAGFMLGAAFTPLAPHAGNSAIQDKNNVNSSNNPVMTNQGVAEGALNFTHNFEGGFGLSLTAAGIHANKTKSGGSGATATLPATTAKVKRQSAWQLGTLLSYKGFQLGGGYIDNQQSGVVSGTSNADGGKGWSGALSYTFGATKVAAGGQWTTQKNGVAPTGVSGGTKGTSNIYSFTADHTLAPGLAVYAEYDYLDMKTTQGAMTNLYNTGYVSSLTASNKGAQVGVAGLKVSF